MYETQQNIIKLQNDKKDLKKHINILENSLKPSKKERVDKNISANLSKYYDTDEGKSNKQTAHQKRSDTMRQQKKDIIKNLTEKTCTKCNFTKDISNFCKKSNSKDGLRPYSKPCINNIKIAIKITTCSLLVT
jgi:phenylpyruvate tautomerase PptA (4-oxalocrotonate tautomerase family)